MPGHRHRGHRPEAVASVFADRDRTLGAFCARFHAILVTGFWRIPVPLVQLACKITFLLTVWDSRRFAPVFARSLARPADQLDAQDSRDRPADRSTCRRCGSIASVFPP